MIGAGQYEGTNSALFFSKANTKHTYGKQVKKERTKSKWLCFLKKRKKCQKFFREGERKQE
jgi:hypothetical protein